MNENYKVNDKNLKRLIKPTNTQESAQDGDKEYS